MAWNGNTIKAIVVTAILCAQTAVAGTATRGINGENSVAAQDALHAPVPIEVYNHTASPVRVVMDRNREVVNLVPFGHAVLRNARLGDEPTLYFINPHTGAELDALRVGIVECKKTVEWRG
jgi:hypothetical protein